MNQNWLHFARSGHGWSWSYRKHIQNRKGYYWGFQKHANSEIQTSTNSLCFCCCQSSKRTFRKQKFISARSKGHNFRLSLVDLNPFCLFLFFKDLWLSPQLWLMAAKKAIVSWVLNFRVCKFLKGTISTHVLPHFRAHYHNGYSVVWLSTTSKMKITELSNRPKFVTFYFFYTQSDNNSIN